MADDARFLSGLSPLAGRPVQVPFDGGRLTSDGGPLVVQAEVKRRLGITDRLARCLEDPRPPERVTHRLAVLAADDVPARELAGADRAQADDGGDDRSVLRQLR